MQSLRASLAVVEGENARTKEKLLAAQSDAANAVCLQWVVGRAALRYEKDR